MREGKRQRCELRERRDWAVAGPCGVRCSVGPTEQQAEGGVASGGAVSAAEALGRHVEVVVDVSCFLFLGVEMTLYIR
jgi:hypothetical protein